MYLLSEPNEFVDRFMVLEHVYLILLLQDFGHRTDPWMITQA